MKIGIAGFGVTGKASHKLLVDNYHDVLIYDPHLGFSDSFNRCDAVFICVPVPDDKNPQNLDIIHDVIKEKKSEISCPIFIRSTILPNTCLELRAKYNMDINHLPEFLTERTCFEDVFTQKIYGPKEHDDLLSRIFGKHKIICNYTNEELELAKYAHNCFGAMKVTYFNMIYDVCEKLGADYEKIREVVLGSGYINETHTIVGLDGKRGYGGKCFVNNMNNFDNFLDSLFESGNGQPEFWSIINDIRRYNERIRH